MTASNCCGVSATSALAGIRMIGLRCPTTVGTSTSAERHRRTARSEEHTSELQSRSDLVCRLLLEKKKKHNTTNNSQEPTAPAPKPTPTASVTPLKIRMQTSKPSHNPQHHTTTSRSRCPSDSTSD